MKRSFFLSLGLILNLMLNFVYAFGDEDEETKETTHSTPSTPQGTLSVLPPEMWPIIVQDDPEIFGLMSQTSKYYKEVMYSLISHINWQFVSNITSIGFNDFNISSSFLKNVSKVQICLDRWEARDFFALKKMKNVQILDLSNNCCNLTAIYFSNFPQLKQLNLMNNFLTEEDEKSLRSRPGLTLTFNSEITMPQYISLLNNVHVAMPYCTHMRIKTHISQRTVRQEGII